MQERHVLGKCMYDLHMAAALQTALVMDGISICGTAIRAVKGFNARADVLRAA